MKSFLTVIGMYQYDKTLFDSFAVPSSMENLKETIIDSICLGTQELEVLYPSVPTLQYAIGVWCKSMSTVWEKMYNTTVLEYNPIENYNRTESITESEKRKDTLTSTSEANGNSEQINQNVAFNNTDFTNNEKNMVNNDTIVTGNEDNTYNTDKTTTHSAKGNIGVTTSQQMIKQERQISEFNIVQFILDDFKQRFCLMIY